MLQTQHERAGSSISQQQQQQQQQQQPQDQQQRVGAATHGWAHLAGAARRLVAVPLDPLCAALNGCTSADAVLAACDAGELPPVVARHCLAGAEWVEFAPLTPEQLRARHARGWHAAPVVWFRFAARAELPPEQVAAGQVALNVLGPGDEAEVMAGPGALAEEEVGDDEDSGDDGDDGDDAEEEAGVGEQEVEHEEGQQEGGGGMLPPMLTSSDDEEFGDAESGGYDGPEDEYGLPEHAGAALDAMAAGPAGGGSAASQGPVGSGQSQHHAQPEGGPPPATCPSSGGRPSGGSNGSGSNSGPSGANGTGSGPSTSGAPGAPAASPVRAAAPGFEVLPPADLGELDHRGPEALVLRMQLAHRRAGNLCVIRLINQENLMQQYGDAHEAPNIDVQYVALRGWALQLPSGVDAL